MHTKAIHLSVSAWSSLGGSSEQQRALFEADAPTQVARRPADGFATISRKSALKCAEFVPTTDKEKALVQTIADTDWRLLRIAPLEASIYAIGRLELADQFPTHADPTTREALILGKIFMTHRKDLTNLALQERRLRNQRKADIAELHELQKEPLETAARESKKPTRGFDFSILEFQIYNQRNRAQYPVRKPISTSKRSSPPIALSKRSRKPRKIHLT